MNPVEAEYIKGKEYTISSSEDLGFSPRTGYEFLGWKDVNSEKTYQPNEKITIYDDTFGLSAVWKQISSGKLIMKAVSGNEYSFDAVNPPISRNLRYEYLNEEEEMQIAEPFASNAELSDPYNLSKIEDKGGAILSVETYALVQLENLTDVDLPNATTIGDVSFAMCLALSSISIPNATKIGMMEFAYCNSLSTLDLPKATEIGFGAFSDCENLIYVNIPCVSTLIGMYEGEPAGGYFSNCYNLISVNISSFSDEEGFCPFENCDNVSAIYVNNDILHSIANEGKSDLLIVNNDETKIIGVVPTIAALNNDKITSIGDSAFTSFQLLSSVNCPNVQSIGFYAFGNSGLKLAEFQNVQRIGELAFYYCLSLSSIRAENVILLEDEAFAYCKNLSSINFPNILSIGNGEFKCCYALSSISIPNVKIINKYVFNECSSLIYLDLSKVETIYEHAFIGCSKLSAINLSGIVDGAHIPKLCGDFIFPYTSDGNILVFVKNTNILHLFFLDSQWSKYYKNKYDPNRYITLAPVEINNRFIMKDVSGNEYSFDAADPLINGKIDYVEYPLSYVNYIYPPYNSYEIKDVNRLLEVNDIAGGISSIGGDSFEECYNLISVNFLNVKEINEGAFSKCSSLVSAYFPNVHNVFASAFISCSNLEKVDLPNVGLIYKYSYAYCNNLEKVNIPNTTHIGEKAFYYNEKLKTINLSNVFSPPYIENDTFNPELHLTVYVKNGYKDRYLTAEYWCDYTNMTFVEI